MTHCNHLVPPHEETYGNLAAGVGAQLGMPMDDEQRMILDAIYTEDEPGVPTCFEVGVVAPDRRRLAANDDPARERACLRAQGRGHAQLRILLVNPVARRCGLGPAPGRRLRALRPRRRLAADGAND